jgi:hypothetical protein
MLMTRAYTKIIELRTEKTMLVDALDAKVGSGAVGVGQ